ncbi:MAG: hemerythrin family protein [Acetatifactor sp.]|nr:hemerythrin family protein [Acetatifactor sp.]
MFQFTSDCIIGIEEIDNEHRHLFELIGQVAEALEKSTMFDQYQRIADLIEELEEYADQHFAHEEAYMEEILDPELFLQRSQHMMFRETVNEMSVHNIDYEEGQIEVLKDMNEFLARWLYRHILGSDILIGKLPPLEKWMLQENPCEFIEEYKTGIPLVDAEHKQLFSIVDKANQLARSEDVDERYEEIVQILEKLKSYTAEHFKHEEEYMESIRYEGLTAQKHAHEAFIDKIENISLDELKSQPKEYMQSLLEFLLGWLINHILHSDKKIPVEC